MPKQRTTKKAPAKNAATPQLYTFEVALISGPLSEKFIKKNPVIARTIEMTGDQTFADLHKAIFNAYDRAKVHGTRSGNSKQSGEREKP